MSQVKQWLLPAYLLLCILLGGSSQAIWGNALLQLLAIAILFWAAVAPDTQAPTASGRRLLLLAGAAGLLFSAQLVPLPPSIWTELPGRAFVLDGFRMLGLPPTWLPVSLSPYDTLAALLTLLPPLALLFGMIRLQCWRTGPMFAAVIVGTMVSILLGILQVSGGGEDSRWYFYRHTNLGVAVGTFANGNHYATLLLASLPLTGALAAARWRSAKGREERSLALAMAVAGGAILAAGILINGSAAMLLLGPPVAAATILMVFRLPQRRVRQGLSGIALLLVAGIAVISFAGRELPKLGTEASIETRAEYWAKSARAAQDHLLSGSGFGTFQKVYRQYEDPADVDRWYVNHAHNDYVELVLEGGLPAILLVALFLWWWTRRAAGAWRDAAELDQKAAAIASAAILLHSAFDYPLRTAAISAIFAMCLALLAGARGTRGPGSGELDRPRHAVL